MKKNSFVFFFSWKDALSECSEEVRLEVYESIIEYAKSGTLPRLKPMAQMAFNFIKVEIDRNNEKYEEIVEKRRAAGKTSRANAANAANANKCQQVQQMLTNATDDVYVYDDVDVDVSLSMKETREKERESFLNFLLFSKYIIKPEAELDRFLAHYEKTDWVTSTGQKITNRMAALKAWKCEGATFSDLTSERLSWWQGIIGLFAPEDKTLFLSDFRGFACEDNKLIIYTTKTLQNTIKNTITDEIREKMREAFGMESFWKVAR